jgi:hypothetical protein
MGNTIVFRTVENSLSGNEIMEKALTVVLYGHEEMLNYTRTAILQGAGFNALSASSLNNFIVLITSCTPDLIIFCQTVSPSEQSHLERIARELKPEINCFSMPEIITASHYIQDGSVTTTFAGGQHFLAVIEGFLQDRTL